MNVVRTGGDKVIFAPRPSTIPNVSAGDDNDKPSTQDANAGYTNLIVGPRDPNEDTGPQLGRVVT